MEIQNDSSPIQDHISSDNPGPSSSNPGPGPSTSNTGPSPSTSNPGPSPSTSNTGPSSSNPEPKGTSNSGVPHFITPQIHVINTELQNPENPSILVSGVEDTVSPNKSSSLDLESSKLPAMPHRSFELRFSNYRYENLSSDYSDFTDFSDISDFSDFSDVSDVSDVSGVSDGLISDWSLSSMEDPDRDFHPLPRRVLDSYASSEHDEERNMHESVKRVVKKLPKKLQNAKSKADGGSTCDYYIDPQGKVFFFWMILVCLALVYNAVAIPLRSSFNVYSNGRFYVWLVCDYLVADMIYLMDILLVQTHLSFRSSGVVQTKVKTLTYNYFSQWSSWLDLLSLLPLDILFFIPSLKFNALLRLPRLLKFRSLSVFQNRFESQTNHPYSFRVVKLVCYFIYIIHVYACIYLIVSKLEGLGVNDWVYNGIGCCYLRSFYWALLTVSTIHEKEENDPETNIEYVVEVVGYLFGIFVLAVIIGEIRNIVESVNSQKMSTKRKLESIKEYMSYWKVPNELQERVFAWYDFTLTQKINLDEGRILNSLPKKMKADLAIHVHLDTLRMVSLFKDFDKSMLMELVLKLKPAIFVPGDYICKKGQIGREMYIVNKGLVQVIGGPEDQVLADLGPGSVFGEISLLSEKGGTRRTAHVVSKGFSSLFVLNKVDLHETIRDYPEAKEILRRKTRYLLEKDKKREMPPKSPELERKNDPPKKKTRTSIIPGLKIGKVSKTKAAITAVMTANRLGRKIAPEASKCLAEVEVHFPYTEKRDDSKSKSRSSLFTVSKSGSGGVGGDGACGGIGGGGVGGGIGGACGGIGDAWGDGGSACGIGASGGIGDGVGELCEVVVVPMDSDGTGPSTSTGLLHTNTASHVCDGTGLLHTNTASHVWLQIEPEDEVRSKPPS